MQKYNSHILTHFDIQHENHKSEYIYSTNGVYFSSTADSTGQTTKRDKERSFPVSRDDCDSQQRIWRASQHGRL